MLGRDCWTPAATHAKNAANVAIVLSKIIDDEEPVEAEYSLGEMSNCEQQERKWDAVGCHWEAKAFGGPITLAAAVSELY